MTKQKYPFFAMCLDHRGYEGSLCLGKVYQVIRPLVGDARYDLRVIDEEGQDYLYPADRFVAIDLPPRARKAIAAAVVA